MRKLFITVAVVAICVSTVLADDMCQVIMSYMNQYQDLYNEAQWRCVQYGGTWCDMQGEYLSLYMQWEAQYNTLVQMGACP